MKETEQLQVVERQPAAAQLVGPGRRIVEIEEAEQRLSVPFAPFSTLLASRESFITDWADS